MKTNLATRQMDISGVSETTEFTMQAGGKAFGVIINGMYSKKAESITREIWSNAYDAHRMSGIVDQPFKVSFPTSLDSSFRCRDYGPGMSHEFMMDGYTIAFHSTKEDTNEAVGFLGLGRLSPFAYTDTYSVTVWDGAMKRSYSIYLDEAGKPRSSCMGMSPSLERSGTEVSFAVDHKDRSDFKLAADRVSIGFDVKPECTQLGFDGWYHLEVSVQGDGWLIYNPRYNTNCPLRYGPNSYAKMGCVLYPIPDDHFEYGSEERDLVSQRLIVDFDIGDLAVTASRESLSFGRNEPTKDSISKKFTIIAAGIEKDYLTQIANSDNLWLAKQLLRKSGYLPRRVTKSIVDKAQWGGTPLAAGTLEVPGTVDVNVLTRYEINRRKTVNWGGRRRHLESDYDPHIIIENVEKGERDVRGPTRIRNWFKDNQLENALWFKVDACNKKDTLAWINETAPHLPITYVKDVADPGPATTRSSGGTRSKVMVKRYKYGGSYSDYDMSDDEFDEGGVYLRIKANSTLEGEYTYSDVVDVLTQAKLIDDGIIVVPATYWSRFEKADQWKELFTTAKEYIDAVGLDRLKTTALRTRRNPNGKPVFMKGVDSGVIGTYNKYLDSVRVIDPSSGLTPRMADTLLTATHQRVYANGSAISRIDRVRKNLESKLYKRYPLLRMKSWGGDPEHYKKYIELMDKENENV